MPLRLHSLKLLIILSSIILTACKNAPVTPTIDPTQAVKNISGTYRLQLTADDLKNSGLTDTDLNRNLGNWQFVLSQDGNFTAELNSQFFADGNFAFNGNEMIIQVLHVCENCSCQGNIGRYAWASDERQLTLKKIYDNCDAMSLILTSKPLVRN